jgi:hypothetical protein
MHIVLGATLKGVGARGLSRPHFVRNRSPRHCAAFDAVHRLVHVDLKAASASLGWRLQLSMA